MSVSVLFVCLIVGGHSAMLVALPVAVSAVLRWTVQLVAAGVHG